MAIGTDATVSTHELLNSGHDVVVIADDAGHDARSPISPAQAKLNVRLGAIRWDGWVGALNTDKVGAPVGRVSAARVFDRQAFCGEQHRWLDACPRSLATRRGYLAFLT